MALHNGAMKQLLPLLLIGLLWPSIPSHAAEEAGWSGLLELSSDYMWRGRSETRHQPAYQGEFDAWDGPFYAGVWFSRVNFGDGKTPIEVDPYMGANIDLDGVLLTLGLGASAYPAQPAHADMNDVEGKIGFSGHFGDLLLGIAVNERIDLGITGTQVGLALGRSQYYEANAAYDIGTHWKVSLGLGQYRKPEHGYQQATATLQYAVDDRWGFALSYADTTRYYDPSLALSVKLSF